MSYYFILSKWLFTRNLPIILPLKSRLSGKFRCFIATYESIKKFQLKWKILKHLTRPKRKIVRSPQQIKASHVSGTYIFLPRYTEIYRHLFSKCFENVLFRKRKGAEKVHCKCYSFFSFFFLTPTGNMLVVKI